MIVIPNTNRHYEIILFNFFQKLDFQLVLRIFNVIIIIIFII